VKFGDQQLERVEKMKYLGVILDEELKLNEDGEEIRIYVQSQLKTHY
jgi:hypothetical protein